MRSDKRKRMMAEYKGFRGIRTASETETSIPSELIDVLTGKQLGLVMDAISKAYHKGKASKVQS